MNRWRYSAFALLLFAIPGYAAAALDKGLPTTGSSLTLAPTTEGYEVSFDVGFDENFSDLKVSSPDGALTLDPLVMKTEVTPVRVKRVLVRVKGGKLSAKAYPLTIVATHKVKKDDKEVPEPIERDVLLVVPSATLDTLATLVINRTCRTAVIGGACLWTEADVDAKVPQLAETTRGGWITGIRISQKGVIDSGDAPAGTLEPTAAIEDVTPAVSHRSMEYGTNYTLKGNFPLGTVKGTLLIQADQLATPLSAAFEIRTRTTATLLLIALSLGLVIGWLTRSFLQGKHDLNQEKQKTFALLSLIDAALASTEDEKLNPALGEARRLANEAAQIDKAGDIETLKTKTIDARNLFDAAQSALRASRAEADQAYSDTIGLLRAPWRVSERLATVVAKARADLEAMLPQRPKNNMTKELETLDSKLADLLGLADEEVARYSTALAENAAVIELFAPLMDPIGATTLGSLPKPEAKPGKTELPATRDKMLPALRAALEYLDESGSYIDDSLKNAHTFVLAQISAWEQQLATAQILARRDWDKWLSDARELLRTVGETPKNSGASIAQFGADCRRLTEKLSETLLEQVEEKDKVAVQERLTASTFASAVSKVEALTRRSVTSRVARGGSLEGRGAAGNEAIVAVEPAERGNSQVQILVSGGTRNVPDVAFGVAPSPHSDAATTAILAAASRRTLEVTGFWLNLIYAAVIIAGGYWLFEESWIGTLRDFVVAFFWAFTTDIGADAATTAVKGLKKS
jgi:hypothetical protein